MADKFKEFQKRFKSGKVKTLANPAPLPGPGGLVKGIVKRAAQSVGSSWREKATEAANRPYKGPSRGIPVKSSKARGNINRAYTPESIKMGAPGRSYGTALTTTTGRSVATRGTTSPAGRGPEYSSGGTIKPSARVSAMTAAKANVPQKREAKVVTAVRPETPGSYMPKRTGGGGPVSRQGSSAPSMAMGGGPVARQGGESPLPKKKTGVNQIEMAKSNATARKKKAGATTGAAPAKPKRRTNLERMRRRQAERFAVGSSGRPL